MEVGEYVRTDKGTIVKAEEKHVLFTMDNKEYIDIYDADLEEEIVKHSKNIIDLIEVGDYVNGEKVINTWNGNRIETHRSNFDEEDIKSIATKEQFKLIEYEV